MDDALTDAGDLPLTSSRRVRRAASRGDLGALAECLDAGAEIEGDDTDADSPLFAAITANQLEAVALLLKRGADPDRQGPGGWRPLHAAVDMMTQEYDGHIEILELLLEHGAQLDARDEEGRTASDLADGEVPEVEELFEGWAGGA